MYASAWTRATALHGKRQRDGGGGRRRRATPKAKGEAAAGTWATLERLPQACDNRAEPRNERSPASDVRTLTAASAMWLGLLVYEAIAIVLLVVVFGPIVWQ